MIQTQRTTSENEDFRKLVSELDKDLARRNGDTNAFFAQFNKIDLIKHVVVVYENNEPVGCGAMKEYDSSAMEVKRMFVPFEKRGKGLAAVVLQELEKWAKELGYKKCLLETGDKMPEAIRLYMKSSYAIIPNYGQYVDIESSICFEKSL
jgi:GNAT superfamily N-acetyltransferase